MAVSVTGPEHIILSLSTPSPPPPPVPTSVTVPDYRSCSFRIENLTYDLIYNLTRAQRGM